MVRLGIPATAIINAAFAKTIRLAHAYSVEAPQVLARTFTAASATAVVTAFLAHTVGLALDLNALAVIAVGVPTAGPAQAAAAVIPALLVPTLRCAGIIRQPGIACRVVAGEDIPRATLVRDVRRFAPLVSSTDLDVVETAFRSPAAFGAVGRRISLVPGFVLTHGEFLHASPGQQQQRSQGCDESRREKSFHRSAPQNKS